MIDLIDICSQMTKEEFLREADKPRLGKINTSYDCPLSYEFGNDIKCESLNTSCVECWDKAVTKANIEFKEEVVNE